MRILLDMNLSPAWASYLHERGHESFHWSEVGPAAAPDLEIMQWAHRNGCIVITADLDFSAILAATRRRGPSVLQIRADLLTPDALGPAVLEALEKSKVDLETGAIVSLERNRMRLRILPLAD